MPYNSPIIRVGLTCLSLLIFACQKPVEALFVMPRPADSGLVFSNDLHPTDSLNILDYLYFYNGGGIAVGDLNNDGWPDIYATANQGPNAVYLNQGDLTFTDVTKSAGLFGQSSWQTGCLLFDANNDGWLDIYVSAVVGLNGFTGHNELYINNHDMTFTEASAAYGLDLQDYGTMSAALDYDLDGDLDLYILNHAIHTQESFGRSEIRQKRHPKTGDRLMRNDGGVFTDVSEQAGIYGGVNAYGLGISVADFNQDGAPDLYIGNDFHEDDYFYINNQDGTFTESLKDYFSHTSRFSMGNDAADINNDGWPDLISLDMLPQEESVIKSSEGDDPVQTLKMRTEQYGYHYQYSRNMLFVSQPGFPYLETALYSDVAATDWSWSALFGDYDLDGQQDLFISNGIMRRPNNLDYIKFISNQEIQRQLNDSRLVDQQAIEMMPSGAAINYFFRGNANLKFSDMSQKWVQGVPSISGASAVADFDQDGDLDLVTNNTNAPLGLYVNQSTETTGHYGLSIALRYLEKNPFGIGTKAYAYLDGKRQYRELNPTRGFQASSEPLLHFGLGPKAQLDSIKLIWPNGMRQTMITPQGNQVLTVQYQPNDTQNLNLPKEELPTMFAKVSDNLGIDFVHKEDAHTDFNSQKLIPYEVSDRGPAVALADFNQDGRTDIFVGNSKYHRSALYLQEPSGFTKSEPLAALQDSISEYVTAVVQTIGGVPSLLLGAGGSAVAPSAAVFSNNILPLNGLSYKPATLPGALANTSVLRAHDNLTFIGNHTVPNDFGAAPDSYILKDGAIYQTLEGLGMVTDAQWVDLNQDELMDLVIVGEWMAPHFLEQTRDGFRAIAPFNEPLSGLWQSVLPFDIDQDGDEDLLLGNWGLNSKFKASPEAPMQLFHQDFDQNGSTETIIAIEKNGQYYPLLGLDDLASQMVFLRKAYTRYADFAGQPLDAIFGSRLEQSHRLQVDVLASGYLKNTAGQYHFVPFDPIAQWAPIMDFVSFDFDRDGINEVLAGGNYFGVIPFHGRYDAFPGVLIDSDGTYTQASKLGLNMTQKSIRHMAVLTYNKLPYLILFYNDEKTEVYRINQ